MKKKIIAAVLTLAMVATVFCGCGKEEKNNNTKPDKQDKTEQTDTSKDEAEDEHDHEHDEDELLNFESKYLGCEIKDLKENIDYDITECVQLCEYNGATIEVDYSKGATQEEIDEYIDSVLSSYLEYPKVDKDVVENYDYVNIDYVGKLDGVAFDGGSAEDYNLGIGTNTFIEGFEEGLIGCHVGDTIDLDLTFPESYHSEELAGKAVVFTVTVNYICELRPRTHETADDEFISSRTIYETYEAFEEAARNYYERNKEIDEESLKTNAAMEYLISNSTIKIPEGLVDAKAEQTIDQFRTQVMGRGYDFEVYLTNAFNMSYASFQDYVKEHTEAEVKEELVLEAIANDNNLKVENPGFVEYVAESVQTNGVESIDEMFGSFDSELSEGELYVARTYLLTMAKNLYKSMIVYKEVSAE